MVLQAPELWVILETFGGVVFTNVLATSGVGPEALFVTIIVL